MRRSPEHCTPDTPPQPDLLAFYQVEKLVHRAPPTSVVHCVLLQLSVNTEAALLVYIEGRLVSNPYRVTFLDLGYVKPSAFDVGIS